MYFCASFTHVNTNQQSLWTLAARHWHQFNTRLHCSVKAHPHRCTVVVKTAAAAVMACHRAGAVFASSTFMIQRMTSHSWVSMQADSCLSVTTLVVPVICMMQSMCSAVSSLYADVIEQISSDVTSVDTVTQWREDWSSASVVSHTVVTYWSHYPKPGFDLPRYTWSLMNRFRTGQGPCCANLHKWGLTRSPASDCGQRQTINHIVNTCPLTNFEVRLNLLHKEDDHTVIWLESTATAALTK